MSYIEHFTYLLLYYSKLTLFQMARAVITKLRDIPVFIFSHS